MRLKNLDRLIKSLAPAYQGDFRAQARVHRIRRGGRIDEFDLTCAPCRRQLSIQFLPARGIGREQAKNLGIRLREPEERADKKSGFGFPAEMRHRAKEQVGLDFSARAELADLVGAANTPIDKPPGSALIAGIGAGAVQRVQLKHHEIILQTDVVAVKM